jgi:hypothetical protein
MIDFYPSHFIEEKTELWRLTWLFQGQRRNGGARA